MLRVLFLFITFFEFCFIFTGVRNIKNRHSTCSGETVMAKNGTFGRRVSISMDFKTFEKRYTKLSDANMTLEVSYEFNYIVY